MISCDDFISSAGGPTLDPLEEFRKPDGTRILVCTSVLQEGIDVPSCNLIVRFDSAFTPVVS